jgi:signal transduction histidine kinase/ligand-binding sensor domain-containing protein
MMPTSIRRVALIASAGLAFSGGRDALALDPSLRISQYGHVAWRSSEGYFTTAPTAIAQTSDGYLWLGSASGLIRFDGVRFEAQNATPGRPVPMTQISSLAATRDGSLWVGGYGAVTRIRADGVVRFETGGIANAIVEDAHDPQIWVVQTRQSAPRGPLCSIGAQAQDASGLRCFAAAEGVTIPYADQLARSDDNALWIGGSQSLLRWHAGQGVEYFRDALTKYKNLNGVGAVAARKGVVWTALASSEPALVLKRFENGEWSERRFDESGASMSVTALTIDRDGALWIGTDSRGVFRLSGDRLDHFGSEQGLTADHVNAFFEDAEANVWALTTGGLDCFRELAVVTFSKREGLTSDDATVVEAQGDTVWVGNGMRLNRIVARDGFRIESDAHVTAHQVTAIADGGDGHMWIGVDDGLLVGTRDRFDAVTGADGAPLGAAEEMRVDGRHDLWVRLVGKPERLVHVRDGRVLENFQSPELPVGLMQAPDPDDGIWISATDGSLSRARTGSVVALPKPRGFTGALHPRGIFVDADRTIWMAAREGLAVERDGVRSLMDRSNGLPCSNLFAVIDDNTGGLWLYASCGIIGIARDALTRWREAPTSAVPFRYFDAIDGAAPAASYFSPWATRSSDGRLWFANGAVVQTIDPARAAPSRTPLVHIERATADRREYAPAPSLTLPPLVRDIAIDYTAPVFGAPRKTAFRYRLQGYEDRWQDAGPRRQAFFNSLSPGHYVFDVAARIGDGAWSAPASIDLEVMPAVWQTLWFRMLAAAVLIAIAYVLYRRRLRRVSAVVQSRYEGKIAERERIARELHDTLLQSIQGLILNVHGVAMKLPAGGEARDRLDHALSSAEAALIEGRDRVHEMRSQTGAPLDLGRALESFAASIGASSAATFDVTIEGEPRELDPVVADEVFWIAREALTNAARHAHARNVRVSVCYDPRKLRLSVADDGVGFGAAGAVASNGHFGLAGMRERALAIGARLAVVNRAPTGVEVQLYVPARAAWRRANRAGALRPSVPSGNTKV